MPEPIRISIPDAKPSIEQAAGKIVLDAIREAGLDPMKAAGNPMVRACLGAWGRNELTREEFIRSMRNLLILNPKLKGGGNV